MTIKNVDDPSKHIFEKRERFLLYSFFLLLTIGLLFGLFTLKLKYYLPLLLIFLISSSIGFLIINRLVGFETINQDLNPRIIYTRRQEEKIVELEEKRDQLLLELDEKTEKLDTLIKSVTEKFEKNKDKIIEAVREYETISSRDAYFSKFDYNIWFDRWSYLDSVVNLFFSLNGIPISFESEMNTLRSLLKEGEQRTKIRNQEYVEQELAEYNDYFNTLETYPLTPKQREAIIIDEHRNLVLAGAGTGKTSTLIGKTGYLLRKDSVKPRELLLLSFGRDPKQEMAERIDKRFGLNLDVNTFHSLGMKIIADAEGEKPSVSVLSTDQIKLQKYIGQIINSNLEDEIFLKNFNSFFLSQTEYKNLWNFTTLGEYYSYLRENNIRSLKGDLVKSFEELEIANWLFLNGIEYEYERKYEHRTANKLYGQYTPDFYLPEYEIYIEHFGIDRERNTAPCVPKQKYLQEMKWKQEIHQTFETNLIETYSYEKQEGNLTEKLLEKLLEHEIEFIPISQNQIFSQLNEMGYVQPIYGLLATFLNLYKSTNLNIQQLKDRAKVSKSPNRNLAFIEVFEKIEYAYKNYLKEQNEIDFNDMIKKATEFLRSNQVETDYNYVLVDEFQDISQSRNQLLTAILNQNQECKLFCVGDDWQSIYRFTGSDLNIMTNFEKYYPYSNSLILDETFRFNNQLSEISTKFILQNPIQLPKELKSRKKSDKPAVSIIHANDQKQELNKLLGQLNEVKSSVFILGRYNRDDPNIKKYHGNIVIDFLTAHKSKGTQTDNVIILTKGGKMGFPCEIVDDPVLNLVLSEQDSYPNSEERRLFYVALTRAKKHVYIISNMKNPSDFVKELVEGDFYINEINSHESDNPRCPRCNSGEIVSRENVYGKFYACNNYPYCDYIAPKCPVCLSGYMMKKGTIYQCSECEHRAPACPECKEGIRVLRNGQYGKFYGCTNYPDCTYTYKIKSRRKEPFYVS